MRHIYLLVLLINSGIAIKFCANRHYKCVDDAVTICAASGTKYCTNSMHGVTWQYSVDGVSGCENIESGDSCQYEFNKVADCFPLHRNYCECKVCTTDADCLNIRDGNGNVAGCEDAVNMTNSSYFKGFAAGKQCGIDNCANALKAAYSQLNQC